MKAFSIDARPVASAIRHTSNDETRLYLMGVFIEAETGAVVGTDGHRLYRGFNQQEVEEDVLIRFYGLVPASAMRLDVFVHYDVPKDNQHGVTAYGRAIPTTVKGRRLKPIMVDFLDPMTYPSWRQVVPDFAKTVPVNIANVNLAYLAAAIKALKDIDGDCFGNIRQLAGDKYAPYVITLDQEITDKTELVVVMPVRVD